MPYQANTGGFTNFTVNRRGRDRNIRRRGRGCGGQSQYANQYQQQFTNQNQFANHQQFANQQQFINPNQFATQHQFTNQQQQQTNSAIQYCQQYQHQGNMASGRFDPTRHNMSQYRWSHGACSHGGFQYMDPRQGHVAHATFQNKFGGYSDFCI